MYMSDSVGLSILIDIHKYHIYYKWINIHNTWESIYFGIISSTECSQVHVLTHPHLEHAIQLFLESVSVVESAGNIASEDDQYSQSH